MVSVILSRNYIKIYIRFSNIFISRLFTIYKPNLLLEKQTRKEDITKQNKLAKWSNVQKYFKLYGLGHHEMLRMILPDDICTFYGRVKH